MSFLKNLFGGNKKTIDTDKKPENTNLIYLLNIWGENNSDKNYKAVLDEILNGNGFLMLPSVNENDKQDEWTTLEAGKTLNLTFVFDMDGLKVLGAFTDRASLLNWSKKETEYTSMRTQDVVGFCKQHGIDRIVINSDQKNMYVLERNRENISTHTIEKNTEVLIGTPSNPLSAQIINKLIENFKNVDTIEEVYQYAQSTGKEISIVLGIKMSVVSDNSRAALHNALNNALSGEKLEMPLDIMILEKQDWLESVRNIENALFYKR
jgi:hypothetical protein